MTQSVYRQLQQKLDQLSLGFPATESGIEIKILQHLFTLEDAALALSLTPQLETAHSIAKRLDLPVDQTAARLEKMTQKGLIFRVKKAGTSRYAIIAAVHGIFEFQAKTMAPDLAQMIDQYHSQGFEENMAQSAQYFVRVIPVGESIETAHHVAPYEDALEILKSKDKIVVTDCFCRKSSQTLDKGCHKPMETCFFFGSMGQYYLDTGMGRQVSLDEAGNILKNCRDQGLVTQPATAQNPTGMCNCCGDCCGPLKSVKNYPRPAELVFSNHIAACDKDECTGCEACLDRCQMEALVLGEDGTIDLLEHRCIGCGLCITTCPAEALTLVPKPGKKPRIPPETTGAQFMEMAKSRGLI